MILRNLLLLFSLSTAFAPPHLKQVTPIQSPFNVIAPTWVIGDLAVGIDGRVYLPRILKGGEPLRSVALSSASEWLFKPARAEAEVESHVAAVFLFRPRNVFSSSPPALSDIKAAGPDAPPIPISVSDPGYPPMSVAEGSVVLELQISEAGSITAVRIVSGIPGITKLTQDAVRSWKFNPAKRSGKAVPGTVIVAITYLRPPAS